MSSIKTTQIDGDVSVGRNVAIGGKARVAGSATIGHNLKVEGWLEAPNIKDINNKGLFASSSALEAAYPTPRVGWWAMVGDSSPFAIYRCNSAGTWTATGGTASVSLTIDAETIAGWVSISSTSELPEDPTDDERGKGYLLGTVLYVYVGTGGDTLDGLYQSAQLKGETGTTVNIGEADIADNLTTDDATKVLSAKQGYILDGRVTTIEDLMDEITDEEIENLVGTTTGSGLYISKSTAKVTGGANTTAIRYYSVTPGKKIKLTLGISSTDSPAAIIAAAAWFSTAPTAANTQGTLAVDKTLAEGVAASPLYLTVPPDVSYLGVSIRTSGGTATAAYVTEELDVVTHEDVEDLESAAKAVDEITITKEVSPNKSTLSGNVYLSTSTSKVAGATTTSPGHFIDYYACDEGDIFKIKFSAQPSSQGAVVGSAYWSVSAPSSGSSLLSSAILNNGDPMSLKDIDVTAIYEVTAPTGAKYLCVQNVTNDSVNCVASVTQMLPRVDADKIATNVEWSVPSTVYAVVGAEKRLYIDCIIKNYDNLIIGLPEGHDSAVQLIKNYIAYTPSEAGTKSVTIDAFNRNGTKVGSKTISIVAIANALPATTKRVCIIGDSGTDIQNMAYYTENELKRMFGASNSALPTFCGTKTHSYYSATDNKLTRYEGHYGRSYSWLKGVGNTDAAHSPLCKKVNGTWTLDIANWRTASATIPSGSRTSEGCGLSSSEKIDVVSFAMGANGTATETEAQTQLQALKDLINAFKTDNANTLFIVQLITLLGTDTRAEKLNSRFRWREIVLNDADLARDTSVIIGDMGCCYDRWYAYRREEVTPAHCYPNDAVERIKVASSNGYSTNDTQHPTAEGSQQLGEAVVPALLKQVQAAGTAASEELTTCSPTAVVVPIPLTLHSLNESKADRTELANKVSKRTVESETPDEGAVTLSVNGYHDLGVRDSVAVALPTTTATVAGYEVEIDGVSSDHDALLAAFAGYDSDPYDYADVQAMLEAQDLSGGTTGTYDLTAAAATALTSAIIDRETHGDTVPEISGATDKQVQHTVAAYTRVDEFLFTFVVGSSWGSVTLPSGVVMADGFDWSEAAAGVTFQVSIQDGVCAYLCVTPSNS